MHKRKLDILWVVLSIGLAAHTWGNELRDAYAPIWIYVALHVQAAILFAVRTEARTSTSRPIELVVIFGSLGYFVAFDPEPNTSPGFAATGALVTSTGALLALVSTYCLGRSFAVLPSLRTIRTSGMYRLVRHPIYMSYLIMEIGIVTSHPSIYNVAVAVVGLGLTLWRIVFEERILKRDDSYLRYMDAVPCRIIPYLY
jgi:protein-S-isoprenylcysteine O-methyltransferase Ste14